MPLGALGDRVVRHSVRDVHRAHDASTLGLSQDGIAGRLRSRRSPTVPGPHSCALEDQKASDHEADFAASWFSGILNGGCLSSSEGYFLARASIIADECFREAVGLRNSIRRTELSLPSLIRENPSISPTNLALAPGVSPSFVSVGVRALRKRDLVVAKSRFDDGRRKLLYAIEDG